MTTAVGAPAPWDTYYSAANIQLWGKSLSDALRAVMPVTADTGQINWTTVTAPSGTEVEHGWEVFKLTDAIGDVYLRVGYGTGYYYVGTSQPNYHPMVAFQIGLGTDGATNLLANGKKDFGRWKIPAGYSTTALTVCYVCCVGTTVTIQFSNGGFFTIERRRDRVTGALVNAHDFVVTGRAHPNGAVFTSAAGASTLVQQSYRTLPQWASGVTPHVCLVPGGVAYSGELNKTLFRWYGAFPQAHPLLAGVTYIAGELTTNSLFSCAPGLDGASHQYRVTGITGAANSGAATYAAALLWE